ncbi:MAG: hypothetical protein J6583_09725 [Gilliamella sp.]|nr:hypothetical protein [Gilliamella sp.]
MSVTAIALIAIYYKSILIYCQQAYHTDLFDGNTIASQEISPQDIEKNYIDEQNDQEQLHLLNRLMLLYPLLKIKHPS